MSAAPEFRAPQDCASMAELRAEIDRMDRRLVVLLAARARYVDRAAELKPAEGIPPAAPDRVAEVLAKVRGLAAEEGLDPDLAETMWTAFIDWAIAHERKAMGV